MGVRKFLLPTMARLTHSGIVVQNGAGLLEPDFRVPVKAFEKDMGLWRHQRTAAQFSHYASLDRLAFLVSKRLFL